MGHSLENPTFTMGHPTRVSRVPSALPIPIEPIWMSIPPLHRTFDDGSTDYSAAIRRVNWRIRSHSLIVQECKQGECISHPCRTPPVAF